MADTDTEAPAKGNFLTKKVGPLPAWAWILAAVGAFVAYKVITAKSSPDTGGYPPGALGDAGGGGGAAGGGSSGSGEGDSGVPSDNPTVPTNPNPGTPGLPVEPPPPYVAPGSGNPGGSYPATSYGYNVFVNRPNMTEPFNYGSINVPSYAVPRFEYYQSMRSQIDPYTTFVPR